VACLRMQSWQERMRDTIGSIVWEPLLQGKLLVYKVKLYYFKSVVSSICRKLKCNKTPHPQNFVRFYNCPVMIDLGEETKVYAYEDRRLLGYGVV
jgi:hypothetical protein